SIEVGSATVMYGACIHTIVDIIIIADSLFIALRFILRRKKEGVEEETEEGDAQEQLVDEIRDRIKEKTKEKHFRRSLMTGAIDSHIHLDRYDESERKKIINSLENKNIQGLIAVSNDLKSLKKLMKIASHNQFVKPCAG